MKKRASITKLFCVVLSLLTIGFILVLRPTTGTSAININDDITNNTFKIPKMELPDVSEVKKDNLRRTIDTLEKYGERSSWEKQNQAIAWAKDRFEKLGLESWTDTYESKGKQWTNTFAQIKGQSKPGEVILVIAHIDSISDNPKKGAPGADDNGSGIAVLLEVTRILKNTRPEKSILFCVFSNEEQGGLGSKAFAQKARTDKQHIKSVINLDVLGYNPQKAPVHWKLFTGEGSLKYKGKILLKTIGNFFSGIINGRDVLLVAGRTENGNLVRTAASLIRVTGGVTVKEIIRNDCA